MAESKDTAGPGAAPTGRTGAADNVERGELKALEEEARALETLNRVGQAVAQEYALEQVVQLITDAATELSGAAFGAFFYNVINQSPESLLLYSLSGAPKEAFAEFPMPRVTAVFEKTFKGEGVVRSADIRRDPRYGKNAPFTGMPP